MYIYIYIYICIYIAEPAAVQSEVAYEEHIAHVPTRDVVGKGVTVVGGGQGGERGSVFARASSGGSGGGVWAGGVSRTSSAEKAAGQKDTYVFIYEYIGIEREGERERARGSVFSRALLGVSDGDGV